MFIGAHGVGILWYSCSLGAVGFIYRYTVFCTVLSRYTHTCDTWYIYIYAYIRIYVICRYMWLNIMYVLVRSKLILFFARPWKLICEACALFLGLPSFHSCFPRVIFSKSSWFMFFFQSFLATSPLSSVCFWWFFSLIFLLLAFFFFLFFLLLFFFFLLSSSSSSRFCCCGCCGCSWGWLLLVLQVCAPVSTCRVAMLCPKRLRRFTIYIIYNVKTGLFIPTPLDDSSRSVVNKKTEGGSETAYWSSEVRRTTGVISNLYI